MIPVCLKKKELCVWVIDMSVCIWNCESNYVQHIKDYVSNYLQHIWDCGSNYVQHSKFVMMKMTLMDNGGQDVGHGCRATPQ